MKLFKITSIIKTKKEKTTTGKTKKSSPVVSPKGSILIDNRYTKMLELIKGKNKDLDKILANNPICKSFELTSSSIKLELEHQTINGRIDSKGKWKFEIKNKFNG